MMQGQALVCSKPVVTFELYNASEGLHCTVRILILMEDRVGFGREGHRQGRTC